MMGPIDTGRWITGGFAAAAVIWLAEGFASILYSDPLNEALMAASLSLSMTAGNWALSIVMSVLVGLFCVFLYALALPRFGPGSRTAVIVACAYFCCSTLVGLLGYLMIGLYPPGLLVMFGVVGLAELIVATLVGAWLYSKD